MNPIAIFRHAGTEGAGYFATFAERHSLPCRLFRLDEGEEVPRDARAFSGLVFMGGPMSVNDNLPWIRSELELIRGAVAADVPVLGHCLGGQLIAKALGATVTRAQVKEIGWGEVAVVDNGEARNWFGELRGFLGFHWHGETFAIPPGFTRILESRWCPNQAYARGKHLGMQCHVEMTEDMVRTWCEHGAGEIAASPGPAVQPPARIRENLASKVAALNAVAERLYSRWARGLRR
ncbi:MAG: type 1 glutamine amidotransferase [Pseudomonadota bacterium]|jgi:GMP synthase-like glutamine amidotransferase